jgi:hypothetical protein
MLFLRLHNHGVVVNEVFWGLWLFPFGLLLHSSRFLPRLLGVWLKLNCCAYVALSVTGILWQQYQARVWNVTFPVMFGELAIMLWLIVLDAKERPARVRDRLTMTRKYLQAGRRQHLVCPPALALRSGGQAPATWCRRCAAVRRGCRIMSTTMRQM